MLFEDRYDEFWPVIEDAITPGSDSGGAHVGRIDRIAHLFLQPEQWLDIQTRKQYQYTVDNPVQAALQFKKSAPELRLLAAVIAMWRLCMLIREGAAPMEYLLHCLLAQPYKAVLDKHEIYDHVCILIRALAVRYHLEQGNVSAARLAFAALEATNPKISSKSKRSSKAKA